MSWKPYVALAVLLGCGGTLPAVWQPPAVCAAQAAMETVEADGSYIMGDGIDESIDDAKARAREDAVRRAADQVGIYVESYTQTQDGTLTEDDVFTVVSQVLSVEEESYTTDDMATQGVKILCHIRATVKAVDIEQALKTRRTDPKAWAAMKAENQQLRTQAAQEQEENITLKTREYQDADAVMTGDVGADVEAQGAFPREDYQAFGMRTSEELQQAIKAQTAAIAQNPGDAAAYAERGRAYQEAFKNEDALWDFDEAVRLAPQNPAYHFYRSLACGNLQRYDEALQEIETAVRLAPTNLSYRMHRASIYEMLGRQDEARKDYEFVIANEPEDVTGFRQRPVAYRSLGRYADVIRDCTDAAARHPENAAYEYYMMAETYLIWQKYDEARTCAEHAEVLQPGFGTPLLQAIANMEAMAQRYGTH